MDYGFWGAGGGLGEGCWLFGRRVREEVGESELGCADGVGEVDVEGGVAVA